MHFDKRGKSSTESISNVFKVLYKRSPSVNIRPKSNLFQKTTFLISDQQSAYRERHVHWTPAVSPNHLSPS